MLPRHPRRRAGMTLVEILVVIAIIAILASLLVAALIPARNKAREVQVRADISALEAAISQFKTAYNQTPIPCSGGDSTTGRGFFRLTSDYSAGTWDNSPELQVLKRMFPRMKRSDNGLKDKNGVAIPATTPVMLDPNQCMVFFLTGGSFTDYTGFSTDPEQPFKATGSRKNAFFELPTAKRKSPKDWFTEKQSDFTWLKNNTNFSRYPSEQQADLGNNEPWMIDPWGNPYLYFSTNVGNDYPFQGNYNYPSDTSLQSVLRRPLQIGPWGGDFSPFENGNQCGPGKLYSDVAAGTQGPSPFRESDAKFTNRQTFQIISAGPDGQIGPGSPLKSAGPPATFEGFKPAGKNYTQADAGGDDYANFHPLKLSSD